MENTKLELCQLNFDGVFIPPPVDNYFRKNI